MEGSACVCMLLPTIFFFVVILACMTLSFFILTIPIR